MILFRCTLACFGLVCMSTVHAVDQRDFHESTDHYRERVKDFERAAKDFDFIDRQSLRIIDQLEDLSSDLERASSTDLNRSAELLQLIAKQQVQVERAIFSAYARHDLGTLTSLWQQVRAAGQLMDGQYRIALNLPLDNRGGRFPRYPNRSPYDPLAPLQPVVPDGLFGQPNPLGPVDPLWGHDPLGGMGGPNPNRIVLGYTGSLVPGVELIVTGITRGSLAERIGLNRGDRIVRINGVMPQDEAGISSALASRGGDVTLDVYRGAQPLRLRGNAYQARRPVLDDPRLTEPFSNEATILPLDRFNPPATVTQPILLEIQAGVYRDGLSESLVIEQVAPLGLGARHGLRVGDRILAVNQRPVSNMEDFRAFAQLSTGGMTLSIDRTGVGPSTLTIRY